MKKVSIALVALVMVFMMVFLSCTSKPASTSAPAPAASTSVAAPASNTASTPAAATKTIEWVGQAHVPTGLITYAPFKRIADKISLMSGGRLLLKPQPAGAIVPATKEFDGVDKGVIDFAMGGYTFWVDKWPGAGLFAQEVGDVSPMEKHLWLTNGEGTKLAQQMISKYDVYIVPGGGLLLPPQSFLNSSKPFTKIEDLKGMKMRAPGDAAAILSRMGVSIVQMGAGDIYESMQRKVIDAFELGDVYSNYTSKLHEVTKYLYLSKVLRSPHEQIPFYVKKSKYDALPNDLKEIINQVAKAEATDFYAELAAGGAIGLQKYKDYGVVVEWVSPEVDAEFLKIANAYYAEQTAKDPFSAQILKSLTDYTQNLRKTVPRL